MSARMVKNFTAKYKKEGLERICELFYKGVSNQKIAEEFGVTRQRVHQWQKAFTTQHITFTEEVLKELGETKFQTGLDQ
jgi:transposase